MTFNPHSTYLRVVIEKVLSTETNDARFEAFCNSVVAKLEGDAVVIGTTASWDMGRDGVGLGRAAGIYLCTSLRDDIDAKVLSDLERITSTTKDIARLYFCSSHRLSEHAREKFSTQLRDEAGLVFPITCLGASQLAEISSANPSLAERHYQSEMTDVFRVISADPSEGAEIRGLRLALISSAAEDSYAIRQGIYSASLLDLMKTGNGMTLARCCKGLADSLHLNRNLAPETLLPHLNQLLQKGFVACESGVYSITPIGLADVKQREQEGMGRLLALRGAVRDSIEEAIGAKIVDDEYSRIWSVFEERMTHYFLSRGEELVTEIGELLGPDSDIPTAESSGSAPRSALSFLEELANAVGNTSSHVGRKTELTQAVKDIFTDRTSPAAEWLVRIAASFLAACALGLESSSSVALQKLLSRTRLVLDTDVALSLMGDGEPEHEGVEALVTRWHKMGGRVLIAEPVLEEVSRHAYIAQVDFDRTAHLLPGTQEERLHLIGNVFVRSFGEAIAQGKAKLSQWRAYISQFRGAAQYQWANTFSFLQSTYSIEKLPSRSLEEAELERQVRQFLLSQAAARADRGPVTPFAEDKARRDAQLYAALVHHVATLRRQDPGATCLLVSSARRLAIAEEQFHGSGEAHLIVSIGALLHLLSLLPDVSLGLSAMKAFLFDEHRQNFSSDLERTLMRMVSASSERSIKFAKRGLLMRSVRDHVLKDAAEKGIHGSEGTLMNRFEREGFTPQNQANSMALLSAALDEAGVQRRSELEKAALQAKIKELEAQLERQKNRVSR